MKREFDICSANIVELLDEFMSIYTEIYGDKLYYYTITPSVVVKDVLNLGYADALALYRLWLELDMIEMYYADGYSMTGWNIKKRE